LTFLRRNLYHCQRNVKVDAYQTYVRPILEYAVTGWAPYTQRNINKIESIQRRVARFVLSDFSTYSSVTVMLSRLKWSTLHHRRHTLKLTILHNLVDLCLPNYIAYNASVTRGHKYKLSIPFSRVDVYKYSSFPSTIPKWNSLPASTVEVASVDSFVDLLWQDLLFIIGRLTYFLLFI